MPASATTIESDRRREVAKANLEAASDRTLDPLDPRWLVALEAAKSLQGPLLTFERRRTVLAFANRIGVRPFDANLIIAAMQDRARRGEPLDAAMPTVALTAAPPPRHTRSRRLAAAGRSLDRRGWMPILFAALIAAALHGWVIVALLR